MDARLKVLNNRHNFHGDVCVLTIVHFNRPQAMQFDTGSKHALASWRQNYLDLPGIIHWKRRLRFSNTITCNTDDTDTAH